MDERFVFTCAVCETEAGSLRIDRDPVLGTVLVRYSFLGVLTAPQGEEIASRLGTAIDAGDIAAVYEHDHDYASFYCPPCDACYCGDHWDWWDVWDEDDPDWHDCVRGRCPAGHERMLQD